MTERYIEAIRKLLLTPEQSSIQQGVELASALGEPEVFAALLDGVRAPALPADVTKLARFPTLLRNDVLDGPRDMHGWLDLAAAHLVGASELPIRGEVVSLSLGASGGAGAPTVWLGGLERLESLTHLDLYLPSQRTVDLQPLTEFPSLRHLRLRGSSTPTMTLPSLPKLEVLEGGQIELDPSARYPNLRTLRGRLHISPALTVDMAPNLEELDVRRSLVVDGFRELRTVKLQGGTVELRGTERVGFLHPNVAGLVAPDLRDVETLESACVGLDVSQLDSLGAIRLNGTGRFTGGTFPPETTLLDPRVIVWGPGLTDLGNIGELAGLEALTITRAKSPTSLASLRHATELRMLDVRNSPGITDLSPLVGLPNLQVVIIRGSGVREIPPELVDVVESQSFKLG